MADVNNTLRWNNQLQELHDAVSQARIAQAQNPTDASVETHNKARAEFIRHKLHQTRTALHEKVASLSMEKDTTKWWILTKLLNEDNLEKRQTFIESQNEHLTQKRACFAHIYQEESTIKLPRGRTRHVRNEIKQLAENTPTDGCMPDAIQRDF